MLPPKRDRVSRGMMAQGIAWLRAAQEYPTLLGMILEQVQNAIDANAKRITILADLKHRRVQVTDDGHGVTLEMFERALASIGITMKVRDKLGRFGLGLISPLGKCERFTFTSCPQKGALSEGYREWEFVTEDVAKARDSVGIPCCRRPDLMFSRSDKSPPKGKRFVSWRTCVDVKGVVNDNLITKLSIPAIVDAILERFNIPMLKNGVIVEITYVDADGSRATRTITGRQFQGEKLPEARYYTKESGDTIFRLYLAPVDPKKGARGKVGVGEWGNDFRFTVAQFAMTAMGYIDAEALSALRGGVFEGEIISQKAELHPGRSSFVKNDAFVGLCICINSWFQEVGAKHIESAREGEEDTRHTTLMLRSMQVLDEMLRQEPWKTLRNIFTIGNIGTGHARVPSGRSADIPTTSTQGGGGKSKTSRDGDTARADGGEDRKERPEHHPGTVQDTEGTRRKEVRGGSTGITFARASLPTSSKPYVLDLKRGVLTFNTKHPHWALCDETDTALMRYIETTAIHALTLAVRAEGPFGDVSRELSDEILSMEVYQIAHGDRLSGRRKSGK